MPSIFTLEDEMFYEGIGVNYDVPRVTNRGTDGNIYTVKLSDRAYASIDDIKIRITSSSDMEYFKNFYYSNLGTSFLCRWPDDFERTLEAIGSGNGGKNFTLDNKNPYDYYVYKNGVLQTETTDYTMSSAGVVSFVVAPANGLPITATYKFRRTSQFSGGYTIAPRTFSGNNAIVSISLIEVPA